MFKRVWRWLSGADVVARLEAESVLHREQLVRDATERARADPEVAKALNDYREEITRLTIESVLDVIEREVQRRLVEYYNGGYHAGLHEGWTAAKNSQVFPAVDGPARAEARQIFESRPESHPPMTKAELGEELKRRIGDVSGKSIERVWADMRKEHPDKTKGPGAPKGPRKNAAPISE
ncbi:MAG: hypothetical protein JNM47_01780 [Hyphomonadaceae bacterium]|nr:hypothetical protein [Hyphomonadaceae bacterium]